MVEIFKAESVDLLRNLISTPSFSREESDTADIIECFLNEKGIKTFRKLNNIWAYNKFFSEDKPTILLNSHHDTVKPNKGYTRDPFDAVIENGILYGLGSNDAGASVVALIAFFRYMYERSDLKYNLCIAITAEEEVSGVDGVESILGDIGKMALGIVGEPTGMQMAVAERGLMVVDCVAHGKSGHSAREEGDNAIYRALKDIEWFRTYRFDKVSEQFGQMKMNVTVINAGTLHNVIPAECCFTVDIRINEYYTHEDILEIIKKNVSCDVTPRSIRLKPSSISTEHPIVKAGLEMRLEAFGSPTTSDQSLMDFPTLKIGVGDSARSHSADEYIYIDEINKGIDTYIKLFESVL